MNGRGPLGSIWVSGGTSVAPDFGFGAPTEAPPPSSTAPSAPPEVVVRPGPPMPQVRFGNPPLKWDGTLPEVVETPPPPKGWRQNRRLQLLVGGGVAVVAAILAFLVLGESAPGPAQLRLSLEAGRTYPLRYRAIGDEHLRVGDRRMPVRTELTGVVALKIDSVDPTGLASFTARMEAPQLVVNGKPRTLSVLKTKGKLDRRGMLVEGGWFRIRDGFGVPLALLSITPALPDGSQLPGSQWTTNQDARRATELDSYTLTGRFVRYADEAATRAIVQGTGSGIVAYGKDRGRIDSSGEATLDPATGLFDKTSESGSLDVRMRSRGGLRRFGGTLTVVGTWTIELEPFRS